MKRFFPLLSGLLTMSIGLCLFFLMLPTQPSTVCANSLTCANNLNSVVENDVEGIFHTVSIHPPTINLTLADLSSNVLGNSTMSGEKHISVDLTTQTLYAYQGHDLFMTARVSTGKWFPTPTGTFKIWVKLRSTRMSGGEGADYYNLPNVPYTMFFSNDQVAASRGFSLHGAYWHNNFGHPMSHGCVNMRTIDAEKLYNWVSPITNGTTTHASKDNPGTEVTIYGEAPL